MPGFIINGEERVPGPGGSVEAARAHRWRFEFDQIVSMADVVLYAKTCQRPSVEIDTINMFNNQNQIRLPGKYRWLPINVRFYEISEVPSDKINTTASEIFNYWSNNIIAFSTNTINPKFRSTATIFLEDGLGNSIWQYKLFNAWPNKIEPSELDYTSSEIATIQITLNYDSAGESK